MPLLRASPNWGQVHECDMHVVVRLCEIGVVAVTFDFPVVSENKRKRLGGLRLTSICVLLYI